MSVGEGPYVSHCLHGGTVKAQIPCSPSSLNTLALNLKNTEHRVGARFNMCCSLQHYKKCLKLTMIKESENVNRNDCNLYAMFIFQVMTVGGSSHQIDVFTNFSYRAFSLSF